MTTAPPSSGSPPSAWPMQVIGHVESCFGEKFAIPRQPGLTPSATARLVLQAPFNQPDCVRGLEAFSHVWLLFVFHAVAAGWHPTVRPPKLGGNRRVGVFASRATHRPNPLGLSVVQLEGIDTRAGVILHLRGADLLDGTPVLDIKPYLAYADALPDASNGYADTGSQPCPVSFSPEAEMQLQQARPRHPDLRALLIEVLAQDPRPGYADDPQREYGMQLHGCNIRWRCQDGVMWVIDVGVA